MISTRLMVAFAGTELPADVAAGLSQRGYAGVTLFRDHNVQSIAQVRELTAGLQAVAPDGNRPLLIATDQEGGQLNALGEGEGGATEFAGAMALGATGDPELAGRVAQAMARELLAAGVNVDYAPVCDLATNPDNPGIGIRSFGDDPESVAPLVAATVRGLQAEGVAATAKHFPGIGDVDADTHHQLAVLRTSRGSLDAGELVPFRAAIDAGAHLVMAGHAAVPALTGDDRTLPASLARPVVHTLLREELGFGGLTITDALDMRALAQGAGRIVEAIVALRAGEDLLLATPDRVQIADLDSGLTQAAARGLLTDDGATIERLQVLRRWLAGFGQPGLDVVGSTEHRALAAELAERSLTLLRNEDGLLPLQLPADARIAVIQSQPSDLTPADTSSRVKPSLAAAIRRRHPVDELIVAPEPSPSELAALCARVVGCDLVVVGTVAANIVPAQAELARAVLSCARPTITVALRTPWDLPSYAESRTHMCTYGALSPTTEALAAALFGEITFRGRLPVMVGDLYPRGHGLSA